LIAGQVASTSLRPVGNEPPRIARVPRQRAGQAAAAPASVGGGLAGRVPSALSVATGTARPAREAPARRLKTVQMRGGARRPPTTTVGLFSRAR
jgi:hypothetical protein